MPNPSIIQPEWPVPANIVSYSTTRLGGVSTAPWDSLNLASHVGDIPADVTHNRQYLMQAIGLPQEPIWLNQIHGCGVWRSGAKDIDYDASVSSRVDEVCAVMTADCLPLLICSKSGDEVAAVHAGWKGLAAGVIENTVQAMHTPAESLLVWLGPAIGPQAFEVGEDVLAAFAAHDASATQAFIQNRPGHWLCDIYQLARQRLQALGVSQVYGGDYCTYTDKSRFFSYRRDGTTGRMASLIWIKSSPSSA